MASSMSDSWDNGARSDMISIGTHKLYLSVAGPDRKPGEPIVLLMQGLGSTIDEWIAVRRLVTPFARWLQYDRSGLGRSESPPEDPEAISAVSVASELDTLLRITKIAPPFIIVCHSWGGITSREFLHLRPDDVVGMIFVDANTENTYDKGNWPLPCWNAVTKDLDWMEASGLAASRVLSDEEWEVILKDENDPRRARTEAAEAKGYRGDFSPLAAKKQFESQALGNRPVSVIQANTPQDFRRMYDAGVAAGNGTDDDRALCREWLDHADENDHIWQKEILRLSSVNRYTRTSTSGHNVQMVEPDLIADEIRWVWDHVQSLRSI